VPKVLAPTPTPPAPVEEPPSPGPAGAGGEQAPPPAADPTSTRPPALAGLATSQGMGDLRAPAGVAAAVVLLTLAGAGCTFLLRWLVRVASL